jgi:hypothetical protein
VNALALLRPINLLESLYKNPDFKDSTGPISEDKLKELQQKVNDIISKAEEVEKLLTNPIDIVMFPFTTH